MLLVPVPRRLPSRPTFRGNAAEQAGPGYGPDGHQLGVSGRHGNSRPGAPSQGSRPNRRNLPSVGDWRRKRRGLFLRPNFFHDAEM